ncbi:MAG: hypothetical protein LUE24_03155 [Lachnospiraceae bacterium]|nr:hypothetical protein [Lachnospiraceae bacterium]
MTDRPFYESERAAISEQNMQLEVIERRPGYTEEERETVKADIGRQLFTVFADKRDQPLNK